MSFVDALADDQLDRDLFKEDRIERIDSEESESTLSSKLQVKSMKQDLEQERAERQAEAKRAKEMVLFFQKNKNLHVHFNVKLGRFRSALRIAFRIKPHNLFLLFFSDEVDATKNV